MPISKRRWKQNIIKPTITNIKTYKERAITKTVNQKKNTTVDIENIK